MRPHVPEDELHAYADEQLSPAQRAEIAEHLLACLICRALYGEVEELRSRTAVLLSRATPVRIARPVPRRRTAWGGPIAAGLLALAGGTTWLALQPAPRTTPTLATAFVAPAIFADVAPTTTPKASTIRQRTLTIAERSVVRPRFVGPVLIPVAHGPSVAQPTDDVDPASGPGWEQMSLEGALETTHGTIARLAGVPVTRVTVHRSDSGERPTVVVRHQLPGGRAVWVVEGTVDELASLTKMFEASGLAMSMPQRTRPDYLGSDANPTRTIRMVALAAYLPVDSLDALMAKVDRN